VLELIGGLVSTRDDHVCLGARRVSLPRPMTRPWYIRRSTSRPTLIRSDNGFEEFGGAPGG